MAKILGCSSMMKESLSLYLVPGNHGSGREYYQYFMHACPEAQMSVFAHANVHIASKMMMEVVEKDISDGKYIDRLYGYIK